uniref:Ig-like domain-containing protein n=1 Tax=Catharus ustulatus TaxID=91951 RepID=A0A8C3UDY9_CATUS
MGVSSLTLTPPLFLAAPAHSPSVFPLVSCSCDGDRVSFGCLASGFFPTPAAITWEGVASGEALSFPEVSTASDALSVTSRVTAPAEEAEGGEFVCRVQHRSSDVQESVTACPPAPALSISLLADPNQDGHAPDPAHVLLLCQVRGRGAADARLTWAVNGDVTDLGAELSSCQDGGGAGHATLSGRANVSRELWEGGANFSCQADHAHLDTPLRASLSTFCPQPSPSVLILPPSLRDLYLSPSPNLTCVASNLKSPRVKFTWERSGGGGALGVATSGPFIPTGTGFSNRNWFLQLVLPTGTSLLQSEPVSPNRNWFSQTGTSPKSPPSPFPDAAAVAPKVFAFPPPPEELAASETATLTCLASGFRPRDVLVTWTQQDAPVDERKFSVLGPEEDAGSSGTFSVYSKLSVPAEEWRRGDVFGCVVGHDGIQGVRFIQRNLDKAAARPASVNVSVVLADSDLVCY